MLNEKLFLLLGYLLFCFGTMLGIPHGKSKNKGNTAKTELWRVAHLSTCMGGISIIALVYALEKILPQLWMYAMLLYSAAAYGFTIACTLSGVTNVSWSGDRKNKMVKLIYSIHIVAACLSIIAVLGTILALIFL